MEVECYPPYLISNADLIVGYVSRQELKKVAYLA